jgi:hypothetical protein
MLEERNACEFQRVYGRQCICKLERCARGLQQKKDERDGREREDVCLPLGPEPTQAYGRLCPLAVLAGALEDVLRLEECPAYRGCPPLDGPNSGVVGEL